MAALVSGIGEGLADVIRGLTTGPLTVTERLLGHRVFDRGVTA